MPEFQPAEPNQKMKNPVLLTCCLTISLATFGQQKEFGWLRGCWKIEERNVYEFWQADKQTKKLLAKSFSIENGDSVVTESIQLLEDNGNFYYVPDVAGEQGPVLFKITSYDTKSFVAENPQHDFPKIIRYQLVERNSKHFLHATIEGGGKEIEYVFLKQDY
jgi:hypothetical protein